jgi:SAM-dependent methyltransferase
MLFFARPIGSDYDYQDYYPYLADFDRARFEWEIGIRRPKLARQLALIRRMMPQAVTLLDVGAGPGYLCAVAREQGFEPLGIEPSSAARLAGEQQFSVAYTELDEVSDGSLDVITCHHVLEHIEWPAKFVQTLRTKLRPGGLLVLHVPHQQPLSFLLREKSMKRQPDTFCTLQPSDPHKRVHRTIANLPRRASFVSRGFTGQRVDVEHALRSVFPGKLFSIRPVACLGSSKGCETRGTLRHRRAW